MLSAQGSVEENQKQRWTPAVVNSWLPVGTSVRTGERSRAALLLADETQLKIDSNSQLQLTGVREAGNLFRRVAAAAGQSRESVLSLTQGQVWLRARNKPANLKVTTPAVTAAIRGTEFDLRVGADGESVVTVLEGAVDFRNNLGAVLVNPGERGTARVGQAPTKTVLINPTDAVQWTLVYPAAVSPRDFPEFYEARTAETPERRGWTLLAQNRAEEALGEFEKATGASEATRLGRSIAEYQMGKLQDAYEAAQGPGARLAAQRALLDLTSGDGASARGALEKIGAAEAGYAQAQALLSNVYLTQNKKEAARAAAERAVAADPKSPTAQLALSLVEQSEFRLPAALRAAERARALDPGFVQANLQYARLLFGTGETAKAEQIARGIVAASPREALAHSALGFILLARARNKEARESLDEALRLDSSQGEPHLGLGILDMREGRRQEAVEQFMTAATLEPGRSLYQSYLAKALYELRRFDQAFDALKTAEALDPQDPTPHLYAGIFQNDLIRPGDAVKEFQAAISLNDKRAVYRSRFLLDEDLATKNVDLASAYQRMGLTDWANLHAVRSEMADPGNSAAHLFLADTFLSMDGRLAAGGGELLLARLLMPANANSFNSFNSYTTLFDKKRADFSLAGTGGSFGMGFGQATASGGTDRLAYGVSWNYNKTNGFRSGNDDQLDRTGSNLMKVAITPHTDVLLEYDRTNGAGGDHGGGTSAMIGNLNDPFRRTWGETDREAIGFHAQLRPGSDFVAYAARQGQISRSDNPRADTIYDDWGDPLGYGHRLDSSRTPYWSYQAAHLVKISKLNITYGFSMYQGKQDSRSSETFAFLFDPSTIYPLFSNSQISMVRFRTGFAQANYTVNPSLTLTAGLNYDWANHDDIFLTGPKSTSRWDPNAGVIYSPTRTTTFRFGAMRVLQTDYQEHLAPTQVAGFAFNQNETPLTASHGYYGGWDQEIGESTFLRTTAFRRLTFVPAGSLCGTLDCAGESYGGGAVLNRMLTSRWTLVPELNMTHAMDPFSVRHEYDGKVGTHYVHPRGFSLRIEEEYFHQRGISRGFAGLTGDVRVGPAVWMTNASAGYEFPNKHGVLSFDVTNLEGRRYAFLADPMALDQRIPRRQAAVTFRVVR